MRFDSKQKVYLGVLLTTAFSVTLSVVVTGLIGGDFLSRSAMLPATIVPLIVAPIASFWCFLQAYRIEELNAQLAKLVNFDALTGVHSRSYFFDKSSSKTVASTAAVLMIDADNFKQINDTHGHDAGDKALKHIADIIVRHCRKDDIVARLGGEEFAVYMSDTSLEDAETIAERIRAAVSRNLLMLEACSLKLTVSVGVAQRAEKNTLQEVVKRADQALYDAKNRGRNLVCVESRRVEPQYFPPHIAAKLTG